jgi:predicted phosphodiesterase
MRYLILADIHANIDALEAINESFDRVLFLGDLVDYGPAPEEAVQWIRKAGAIGVCGNHDFAMATGADCRSSPVSYSLSVATREYFRPLITKDSLEYLRDLPEKLTLWAEGTRFSFMHATPRDPIYEYLGDDASDAAWLPAVGDLANDQGWLLVGHTHRLFVRRIGPLTIVNPGSLGMPVDGDPRACYAIWHGGEVELKRVGYDVGRAVERLRSSQLPEEVVIGMSSILRYAGRGAAPSRGPVGPVRSQTE